MGVWMFQEAAGSMLRREKTVIGEVMTSVLMGWWYCWEAGAYGQGWPLSVDAAVEFN